MSPSCHHRHMVIYPHLGRRGRPWQPCLAVHLASINIVDDEPTAVSTWLPFLADALGAKPPRRVPIWFGRLAIGDGGVSMMATIRGGSNAKAKRELEWQPIYPRWWRGFAEGLG